MSVLIKKNNGNLQHYDSNSGLVVPAQTNQAFTQDVSVRKELKLHDIIEIIKRRKLAILLPLLLTLALAVLYTLSTPASYRSNATIQIEREGVQIVDFGSTSKPADAFGSDKDPFFRTRYEMLKSRVLSQKVINDLNLKESLSSPEKKPGLSLSTLLNYFGAAKKSKTPPRIDYNEIFQKNLLIKPINGTHLVQIIYEAPTAKLAKDVVSSLINNFIKLQIETKSETGEYAKNFLKKQLAEARTRLRSSEEALVKYANEKGILGVDEKQTRHVKKLENLDSALVQAEIRRIEAESLYQQMKRAGSVATVLTNPVISNLKASLVKLEGDYQEMLKTFKPNYPDMVRLKQQINNLRSKLNKEMVNIQRSMEADYLAAKRQENKIRNELGQFNHKMQNLQDSSVDYNTLKREVDSNGKLYNNLLQRLEEVNVASAATTSNISILEPAVEPISRYRPKPKINILLGLFSGLLLGLGFAFLREALDQSIKDPEDLERMTGLPVLGSVPRVRKSALKKNLALLSAKEPQNPAAEAYRILATNLRFMSGPEDERVLLITSAQPQEGKSVTASNLACSYAQMGLKVLLVDADIRKASLHKKLNISNKLGLSNYLKGEVDLVGITQPVKEVPGLYAITAGDYEADPVSLLSHERMSYLTTQGASIFDFVIIDSPPVLGFADSLVLSSLASATLVVTQEETLNARTVQRVLKQLSRVKNNVIGFLLVNVRKTNAETKLYSKYHKKRARQALLAHDSASKKEVKYA